MSDKSSAQTSKERFTNAEIAAQLRLLSQVSEPEEATTLLDAAERLSSETIVGRFDVKLDELAKLPHGWDSYGGSPPREDCLAKARQLAALLPEGHWDIVPMSNGGIQIEQHSGGLDIELMIEGAAQKANEPQRHLTASERDAFARALERSGTVIDKGRLEQKASERPTSADVLTRICPGCNTVHSGPLCPTENGAV